MFQEEQISIVIITVILGLAFWKIGSILSDLDGKKKPNRLVAAIIAYVQFIRNYTISSMGERYGKVFSIYIGSVFIYIIVSNTSGLFGLTAPTMNFSVTLLLALITWISIQVVKFRENGVKGYFKSYIEPTPLFLIPNIFSEISPLISLSLRLFGNILAGSVIMSLLYTFTSWVSSFIPLIGRFNFVGVVLAPVLHLYFDLFAGFLQAYLFISLTIIFIGMETPREDTIKN